MKPRKTPQTPQAGLSAMAASLEEKWKWPGCPRARGSGEREHEIEEEQERYEQHRQRQERLEKKKANVVKLVVRRNRRGQGAY
jgi:hypothetical protein